MRCLHQTLGSTKYKLQPGLILVSIEKKLPPSPFHARLTASYCNPWKMKARISLQIASSGMKMHELRRGPLFKSVFQLSLTGAPLREVAPAAHVPLALPASDLRRRNSAQKQIRLLSRPIEAIAEINV